MKFKIGTTLFLSVVLLSFTLKDSRIGVYFKGKDTHHFELNADSTFLYKYVVDTFVDIISEGKWVKKNKNTFLLSSYKEPTKIPLLWERKKTPESKTVRQVHIELVSDKGNEEDFFVIPLTNRAVLPSYNKRRGSYMLETAFLIDSISFDIYKEPEINTRPQPKEYFKSKSLPPKYTMAETNKIELKLHPGESAYITINIKDDDFSYRTFKNTPVEIKKNKLIFKDSENNITYELDAH